MIKVYDIDSSVSVSLTNPFFIFISFRMTSQVDPTLGHFNRKDCDLKSVDSILEIEGSYVVEEIV